MQPHVPDALLDLTKEGDEINCPPYFYQHQPLHKFEDIWADTLRPETKTTGVLNQVMS